MSLRFFYTVLFLTVCAFSPDGAASDMKHCTTAAEKQAMDIRAMQSDLMVAALSCNKRDTYNRFMTSYGVSLKDNSATLRGYFQRVGDAKPERSMNAFVTRLANKSSQASLNVKHAQYCKNAEIVFNMLLKGADPKRVSQHFSKLHNVPACTGISIASR